MRFSCHLKYFIILLVFQLHFDLLLLNLINCYLTCFSSVAVTVAVVVAVDVASALPTAVSALTSLLALPSPCWNFIWLRVYRALLLLLLLLKLASYFHKFVFGLQFQHKIDWHRWSAGDKTNTATMYNEKQWKFSWHIFNWGLRRYDIVQNIIFEVVCKYECGVNWGTVKANSTIYSPSRFVFLPNIVNGEYRKGRISYVANIVLRTWAQHGSFIATVASLNTHDLWLFPTCETPKIKHRPRRCWRLTLRFLLFGGHFISRCRCSISYDRWEFRDVVIFLHEQQRQNVPCKIL